MWPGIAYIGAVQSYALHFRKPPEQSDPSTSGHIYFTGPFLA